MRWGLGCPLIDAGEGRLDSTTRGIIAQIEPRAALGSAVHWP